MGPGAAAILWILKVAVVSFAGGVVGSIIGIGGGIIIVPILVLVLGVPIQDAIGANIISVIAVSCGAGSVYVRNRITNVRIAMFLEVFTAAGAIVGAGVLAPLANSQILSILFGFTLLVALIPVLAKIAKELPEGIQNDRMANFLRLNSSYYDKRLERKVSYNVTGVPPSTGIMFLAGAFSGLLGIGGGVLNVVAQELSMKIPTKVSTATSNFMIGVTAASGAGIYLGRGMVTPYLVVPVASAVMVGAFIGTRLMARMSNIRVRQVFAVVLAIIGVKMVLRGFGINY